MDSAAPRPRLQVGARTFMCSLGVVLVVVLPASAAQGAESRHHPPPVMAIGQPAPGSMNGATAVSCATPSDCWAVGSGDGPTAAIAATTDGGTKWRPQSVPSTVTALSGVSCFDKKHCMAVGASAGGGAVLVTADGGKAWNLAPVPPGAADVTAVACTGPSRCLSLETDGTTEWTSVTSNLGTSWVRGGDLPAGMISNALSCPTPSSCLAAGYTPDAPGKGAGVVAKTPDAGSTWTAVSLPAGVGILRSIACAGASCLAAGTSSAATTGYVPGAGQLLTSSDGGATWSISTGWAPTEDAYGVACPNTEVCVVVGTNWVGKTQPIPRGGIVSTIDGGTEWRAAELRYVPVGMFSVSCPVVDRCVAAGGDVLTRISLPVTPRAPKHARPTVPGGKVP